MSKTVELTNDFALPAYQAGIEVLLLLADAINEVFSATGIIDLLDGSEQGDWIELLSLLGKLNIDPQTRVSETRLIADLWETYFRQNDVRKLEEEVLGVLRMSRDKSVARASSGSSIVDYLNAANDSGHNIARQILKKHGVAQILPALPVPVEVFYDGPGEKYCAGSSLWTNQIRWAYQPVSHSLAGAILADLVFAHEYLSHLVPRNKHLGSTIREQWLVAALRQGLEDDKLAPYWKIRLWPRFRSALESHVTGLARILQPDASVVRYSGLRGAEEMLRAFSIKHTDLFWRLTKEVLESKNDPQLAFDAIQIARSLSNRGLPELRGRKIRTISDLAAIVGP
jgi:hypothetical protein